MKKIYISLLLLCFCVLSFGQKKLYNRDTWTITQFPTYLLFKRLPDKILGAADCERFYAKEFEIKFPKKCLNYYFSGGKRYCFFYKENQAIFILIDRYVDCVNEDPDISFKHNYFGLYSKKAAVKDTVYVPDKEEISYFIDRLGIDCFKDNDYCFKIFKMYENLPDSIEYPKLRNNLVIIKNGAKIFLFNIKDKNIKEFSSLVQSINVIPRTKKLVYDKDDRSEKWIDCNGNCD